MNLENLFWFAKKNFNSEKIIAHTMEHENTERLCKVDSECRMFNQKWTNYDLFTLKATK